MMFAPFFSCSWRLSLLGLREVSSNIQAFIVRRSVRKSTYSTPLESQKMVAITFPAENVVFAFFGFRRFWVTPLHWRTFALRREVMHPRIVRCHDRVQKNPLPARTATTMIAPLAAVYSCVRPSVNAGSIARTLSSIEGVVWWLFSHYHHWCSVFQTTRGQLFACSPEWVHRRVHCSCLLWKSSAGAHEVYSPPFPFLF